jgi:hypothetical protein
VFYRDFDNRRQVGSYFGLVGTPYDSGERSREPPLRAQCKHVAYQQHPYHQNRVNRRTACV